MIDYLFNPVSFDEKSFEKNFEKNLETYLEKKFGTCCSTDNKCKKSKSSCGGLYFVGFVGALVYYIYTATGFWMGVFGVIKAVFWPAFVVFGLLKFLGM